jgi:voltage-gated potassium channel
MSVEQNNPGTVDAKRMAVPSSALLQTRRLEAATIDARMRTVMIAATLLVIPDLIMEEQPLRNTWHTVAVIGDWLIWLVFFVELAAIMLLAKDWRSWLRSYPLAVPMLILTPPFAPAAIQGLRAFRLLRLLRVARGFQLLSKLLTLDGLKYVAALVVFLIVGGGTIFADVQSHAGTHMSTWTGIWWAIGTVSTEGTNIEATTDAGRAIAIVLMLTGMGAFGILTAAVCQRFVATHAIPRAEAINQNEITILSRLDEIARQLDGLEAGSVGTNVIDTGPRQRITDGPKKTDVDEHKPTYSVWP